jgi:hypothetical protein
MPTAMNAISDQSLRRFPASGESGIASGDPDAPRSADSLFEVWRQCGVSCSLPKQHWDALRPVLDRLPALELINPRVDTALAQEVIERHLRQCGKQPRPIRWFPDANSARAYAPAVQVMGRAVFPCFSGGPRAFMDAWTAGDALRKNDRRELARQEEHTCAPPIESIGALLEMFAAGVFYYWIRPHEVLCVRRPSLWMIHGQLHRADGPAVEWPTGERAAPPRHDKSPDRNAVRSAAEASRS